MSTSIELVNIPIKIKVEKSNGCPECGEPLRMTEGCVKCPCGYSRCG